MLKIASPMMFMSELNCLPNEELSVVSSSSINSSSSSSTSDSSSIASDDVEEERRNLETYFQCSFENNILVTSYENLKHDDLSPSYEKVKKIVKKKTSIQVKHDAEFKLENHFYPQVIDSKIHPVVAGFFKLTNETIAKRYKQLNPKVNQNVLEQCLAYIPKHFKYAGSDLFKVTNNAGSRQMIIIETNSCPSGQKSMPLLSEENIYGGYKTIVESVFEDMLSVEKNSEKNLNGDLAVVYDKNHMESSAYCSILAKLSKENVWLVEYYDDEDEENKKNNLVEWRNGLMYIKDNLDNWHPIRACMRYVTQKPWNRIPMNSRTIVVNPIIACLAGGRNKAMAAHAYQYLNTELEKTGLKIRMPTTYLNIKKTEIPFYVEKMNGKAVIKEPYGNCGVGVYTITNKKELNDFLDIPHHYDRFIIQSLVGDAAWFENECSEETNSLFYHIGTLENDKKETFAYDLRMVVTANKKGFVPVSMNGRRARKPLIKDLSSLDESCCSWDMLGTNLSIKLEKNVWDTESKRLITMDVDSFEQLGMCMDDLIDAYIQTVLSIIAIDKMCIRLLGEENNFNFKLYKELNYDDALLEEINMPV